MNGVGSSAVHQNLVVWFTFDYAYDGIRRTFVPIPKNTNTCLAPLTRSIMYTGAVHSNDAKVYLNGSTDFVGNSGQRGGEHCADKQDVRSGRKWTISGDDSQQYSFGRRCF